MNGEEICCGDCPHFDELDQSCLAVLGRFGETVEEFDAPCDFMRPRLEQKYRARLHDDILAMWDANPDPI